MEGNTFLGLYNLQSTFYTQSLGIFIGSSQMIQLDGQIKKTHVSQIPHSGFCLFLMFSRNTCLVSPPIFWILGEGGKDHMIYYLPHNTALSHIFHTQNRINVTKLLVISISYTRASDGWCTSSEHWWEDWKSGKVKKKFLLWAFLNLRLLSQNLELIHKVSRVICCYK